MARIPAREAEAGRHLPRKGAAAGSRAAIDLFSTNKRNPGADAPTGAQARAAIAAP
ncbi:hypothetical protein [Parvibaculum sp.]|uniref:hypothetical protein n=1 Tax=Parvibaculum sp. TaxID=2024848 RepID=UPI00391D1395